MANRATRHVRTLERAAAVLGIEVADVVQAGPYRGTSHGGRIEGRNRERDGHTLGARIDIVLPRGTPPADNALP